MENLNYTEIIQSEWVDKDTFLVCFKPTQNGKFIEQIVGEYHKDDNSVVAEIQIYETDGNFVGTDTIVNEHISIIVKEIIKMKMEEDNSDSFHLIFAKDDFKKHDAFIDAIIDYYAPSNKSLEYEVENIINSYILNLLNELDNKLKK